MQTTIPVRLSKRKARKQRLWEFQCLIDFANLGDTPDDWAWFRRKWPEFFPADITEWIYINAEVWWNLSNLPDTRPDNYREIIYRGLPDSGGTFTIEEWAKLVRDCRREMPRLRPPLLFYRNLLRRVWRRKDRYGKALKELLGMDEAWAPVLEDGEEKEEDPLAYEEKGHLIEIPGHIDDGELFRWKMPKGPEQHTIGEFTWIDKKTETSSGLPIGTPVVDGNTGTIGWDFGCPLQRAVYDLMQERWRAMVCPQCEKYFVADKTAQRYCSPECYREKKGMQALDYYNRKGRHARQKAKALRAKLQRSKS